MEKSRKPLGSILGSPQSRKPLDEIFKEKEPESSALQAGLMQAGNTLGVAPKISAAMATGGDFIDKGRLPESFSELSDTYNKNSDLANEAFNQAKQEHPTASMAGGLINDALVAAATGKALPKILPSGLADRASKALGSKAEEVADTLVKEGPEAKKVGELWLDELTKKDVMSPSQAETARELLDKGLIKGSDIASAAGSVVEKIPVVGPAVNQLGKLTGPTAQKIYATGLDKASKAIGLLR